MGRFPGFQTKTVILGGLRLDIPAHWNSGRMEDGRWWAGDTDNATTLYVHIESVGVWDETDVAQSRPTSNTEVYVKQTVDFLKAVPPVGEIEIDRIQSGYVVHAVVDYEDRGKFRSYRWYSIIGRSRYVSCVRLALVVKPDAVDDPRVVWLFEHFRARAHEVDMFGRTPGGTDPLALKDLSVDDLFAIRIPDDWAHDTDEPFGYRTYRCVPRDPHLGKLIIVYDYAPLKPEYCEGRDPEITNKLADLRDLDFVEDDERGRLYRARYEAPLGVIVHSVDDEKPHPYAEDMIDRLYVRHHQWFYVIAGRRTSLVAFFNLCIPLRWIEQPVVPETVALVEREINSLRLLHAFDSFE